MDIAGAQPIALTKANVLSFLIGKVEHSVIDPFAVHSVQDWRHDGAAILLSAAKMFGPEAVIVRSSTLEEDQRAHSLAGHFKSRVVRSAADTEALAHAIDEVIESFSRDGRICADEDQVLIQQYLRDARVAGVVLTRDPPLLGPYYVINYDDKSRRTDSVTRGVHCELLKIARWAIADHVPHAWRRLVASVRELEARFHSDRYLNIEFGIDGNGVIHVFQVRALNYVSHAQMDDSEIASRASRLPVEELLSVDSTHHLAGRTLLADMSDWNPAEMLGERCAPLDFSLYRYLITEQTWRQARASLGYYDAAPLELMKRVGDKPYIDVRISCASLTPATIL